MLDAALALARCGFSVFPVEPRGKRPLGSLAPMGCNSATNDEQRVAEWWRAAPEANIGVATGPVSGLAVIDLDGEEGADSWGRLLAQHGAAAAWGPPDGATVRTGGGWHLYFALPDGLEVRNSARRIAPGIDVRGEGGYVVAPGSTHPSGRAYEWLDPIPPGGLAPARPWLGDLLAPARREPCPAPRPIVTLTDADVTSYGERRLRGLLRAVEDKAPGGRHGALYWAARELRALADAGHVAPDVAQDLLARAARFAWRDELADRRRARATEAEIADAIRDGWAKGSSAA